MSQQVPLVTACALLLTFALSSATAGLGPTMNGTVIPERPLGLEGVVYVAGPGTVEASGTLVGTDFASSRADLGVLVEQWEWRDGSAGGSEKPPRSSLYTIETSLFQHARVALKRASAADLVELTTPTDGDRAELLQTRCDISRTLGHAQEPLTSQAEGPIPGLGLRAQCSAAGFSIRLIGNSTTQVRFTGTDLEIEGRRVGSRTEQLIVVETGSTVARTRVGSGLYEHVQRRATLTLYDEDFRGLLTIRDANVTFDAPTIVGFGNLTIPPHQGHLTFEGIDAKDSQGPINATGHFILAADAGTSPHAIWLTGSVTRVDLVLPGAPLIMLPDLQTSAAIAGLLALAGLAFFLVSRAKGERKPDHPTRMRILALVEETPGIRLHELVARLSKARGSVMHHVGVLRSEKRILVMAGPRSLRVFPASRQPTKVADPRLEALQVLLAARPAAKQSEIAAALGVSQSFVTKQIRRLEESGDLSRRRTADHTVYWIRAAGHAPWAESSQPFRSGAMLAGRSREVYR